MADDVNITANCNAEIEAAASQPALAEVAAFLRRLPAEESARAGARSVKNHGFDQRQQSERADGG